MLTTPRDIDHVTRVLDLAGIPTLSVTEDISCTTATLRFGLIVRVDMDGWHVSRGPGNSEALALRQLAVLYRPFTLPSLTLHRGIALIFRRAKIANCVAEALSIGDSVHMTIIGWDAEFMEILPWWGVLPRSGRWLAAWLGFFVCTHHATWEERRG